MCDPEAARKLLLLVTQLHAAHAEAMRCSGAIQEVLHNLASSQVQTLKSGEPHTDPQTRSIHWRGRTCQLASHLRFRLFERLARRPNFYVINHQLQLEVWDGLPRSRETLRSTVRLLKRDLCQAGMADLAEAIRGEHQRYGLILDQQL